MTHQTKRAKPPSLLNRYSTLLIALLLLAAIAIVYAQTASFEFLNYDDPDYVTGNPQVRSGLTSDGIAWAFTASHYANWIPLTWISHMVDSQLFGLQSGWHHLTNVLLHAANAVLLFLLLKRATGARAPSAFVAFLFALHPMHVESVAWISERKDVLCAFFFLAAIWAYLSYVERPSIARYTWLAVLFCCALLSKPMAVTLPFVLLLLDLWPLHRAAPLRRMLLEKLPLVALAGVAGLITFLSQQHAGVVAALEQIPAGLHVSNAIVSYVAYFAAFVWPVDLAVFYPYPKQIPAWEWIAAAAALAAATLLIFQSRRRYLIVGWVWYLVTLLPVIGLIQVGVQSRADRYTYLPLIGIAIMVAWGARELFAQRHWNPALLSGLAVAACVVWTAASWWNAQNWRNSITLFQHAVAATNNNFVAHTNLGDALRTSGRIEEAIPEFESALRIRPGDEAVVDNLGAALQTVGRIGEAVSMLRTAIRQHPESYKAHVALGDALARNAQADDAAAQYRLALQIHPDGAEANYGLGGILASQGKADEAVPHLQAGLAFLIEQVKARPDDPDAHYNLGTLYNFLHRSDEAIAELTQAVHLRPQDGRACFNLGIALAAKGRKAEAADQFAEAARLMPQDLNARLTLAQTLTSLGRTDQAAHEYEEILRIDPSLPEARQSLNALRRR